MMDISLLYQEFIAWVRLYTLVIYFKVSNDRVQRASAMKLRRQKAAEGQLKLQGVDPDAPAPDLDDSENIFPQLSQENELQQQCCRWHLSMRLDLVNVKTPNLTDLDSMKKFILEYIR